MKGNYEIQIPLLAPKPFQRGASASALRDGLNREIHQVRPYRIQYQHAYGDPKNENAWFDLLIYGQKEPQLFATQADAEKQMRAEKKGKGRRHYRFRVAYFPEVK